jgi:hypothetical protein
MHGLFYATSRFSSYRMRTDRHTEGNTCNASNPGGDEISRIRPEQPWGLLSPSVLWVPGILLGVKAAEASRWSLPNAEVKERVQLYDYFPSGPSRPVWGWTLTCSMLQRCAAKEPKPTQNNVEQTEPVYHQDGMERRRLKIKLVSSEYFMFCSCNFSSHCSFNGYNSYDTQHFSHSGGKVKFSRE